MTTAPHEPPDLLEGPPRVYAPETDGGKRIVSTPQRVDGSGRVPKAIAHVVEEAAAPLAQRSLQIALEPLEAHTCLHRHRRW